MSNRGGGRGAGRGVGRGRSRGAGVTDTRRPGEAPRGQPQGQQQQVGRGRGRASAQTLPTQPPPSVEETAKMVATKLTVSDTRPSGDQPQRQSRRAQGGVDADELVSTKPQHIDDKRGTTGNPIALATNHVSLVSRPGKAIYQYHVDFNPPVESRRLRRILLCQHKESLFGNVFSFDGMILYLPHKLDKVSELVSQTKEGDNYNVTIKLTNELSANSPICLQLFNVLFRSVLKALGLKQTGRHYYNQSLSKTIPQHKLELWPGYITSILQYDKSVMLCADISHKIVRMDTVLDLFYDIYEKSGKDFHESCARALIGEIVLTRYNNRTYRVDDIDWAKNPLSTFKMADGSEISFKEYYKKQYDININDSEQPLLISQPRKRDEMAARRGVKAPTGPVLLLPELCCRTGLSEEARADFRIMKDVAVHTRQPPQERVETLNRFVNQLTTNKEVTELLGGWNVQFEKSLHNFQGRILPPEKMFMQNTQFSYKPAEADWSRGMRDAKVISAVSLSNYLILFTRRDSNLAQDFIQGLKRVGPPMGIRVDDPTPVELPNDRTESYLQGIDKNLNSRVQMVICLLPQNRKDRYDAIKKKCCVEKPVPSQCVVSRTLTKKGQMLSVATKIVLQLNCKLGGELWALEIPIKGLMVVGIDTYHDSAKKGRSVMGFIASTNATLTRYHSQTKFQSSTEELGDNLKECMTVALKTYHQINGSLPARIVVYRDGVGDGQLAVVRDYELVQIKDAFKAATNYNPKFACIVVKKRINARFFTSQRGQYSNPIPGTVIDSDITKPIWYDFFLVSQSVRQGTVTPTHFNVIEDTSGLKPDHIQRLTYKLTHLYYNWPGTVRVPAPCQYAHKVAFLVGQSIHTTPSTDLCDRLYFL